MNLNLRDYLLDLILPRFCTHCGRLNFFLCPDCYEQIEFLNLPLKTNLAPNYLDQIWAITHYQPPMTDLIKALKYQSVKRIGQFLGQMLYQNSPLAFDQIDLVTWVPLHPKKQAARGFNQTQAIALALTQAWHDVQTKNQDQPWSQNKTNQFQTQPLLMRIKHLPPQASLKNKTQRLTSMKNVFTLQKTSGLSFLLKNKTILLVDDVVTTGATLNACAQILKQAGAQKVFGLAVAHEA